MNTIVVLTPNPSLDKTVVVPGFTIGRINRPHQVLALAGGKGFNLARGLRTLQATALLVAPLAGHTGRLVADLAAADGLACLPYWIEGETRTCVTIVDTSTGQVTEIYEAGPQLDPAGWEAVAALVQQRLVRAGWLAVCGSFTPGVPPGALAQLVDQAHAAGVSTLLDTYGSQLAGALSARPHLVKINQHEAAELVGGGVDTPEQALVAAHQVRARGAHSVVITLGDRGAVGVSSVGEPFGWRSPRVAVVSPVGSGDSFSAGLLAGLTRGQPLADAVRLGVAAGAANTLQIGAGVFSRQQVEQIAGQVLPL